MVRVYVTKDNALITPSDNFDTISEYFVVLDLFQSKMSPLFSFSGV